MTPELNIFYGILTNGDNTCRKTTASTPNDHTVKKLVSALIPENTSVECKRALAELYIRLIQTDKQLQHMLATIDPINSYKLHSFKESFEDTDVIDNIVTRLKSLGIPDEENSGLPFDHIRNGLKLLLEALDGRA